ncbi:MAG: hypothetical protein ACI8X5_000918 [Planctomycetota bacterium]|jgi:hypothetical protein
MVFFHFNKLEVGRYLARVEPKEGFGFNYETFARFPEFTVELSPGEKHSRRLEQHLGGKLNILLEDLPEGLGNLEAVRLETLEGKALNVTFYTESFDDGVFSLGGTSGGLSAERTNQVLPNLEPARTAW